MTDDLGKERGPQELDKDIYTIRPPDPASPGDYLLLITRSAGMMGAAKHAAFYVDEVVEPFRAAYIGDPPILQGIADGKVVCSFPTGTMFLLVPRSQVTPQTDLEAASEEHETHSQLEAFLRAKQKEASDEVDAQIQADVKDRKLYIGQHI